MNTGNVGAHDKETSSVEPIVLAVSCGPTIEPEHFVHQTERCACGCVPNILSMFQMAELRAERRKLLKAGVPA